MKPELLKDVFSRTNDFQGSMMNPVAKFIATGLPDHEGEKWAKHRKIINPAFNLEKLKVIYFSHFIFFFKS